MRNTLVEVHIADTHFGAFNPKTQYEILREQFLNRIALLPHIDIISVDGDLYDHKVMANSDIAMYATRFVADLVELARQKQATLIILQGTLSHDDNSLKLYYHYMNDRSVDVRVITQLQFEEIHGARILMVPELNGLDESIYQQYFNQMGWYDSAFVHGTFEGAVYGNNVSGSARLLTSDDFKYCLGPVISGHVHVSGCFKGYYHYVGSPYRWKFGEEQEKGYMIVLHDLNTQISYVEFEPIKSFRYDTIYIDELVSQDPKVIIDYINTKKQTEGIDYIMVKFRVPVTGANRVIINNYYRNNQNTFVSFLDTEELQKERAVQELQNSDYSYFTDRSMTDFEKFVKFINDSKGCQFITVDKLNELLNTEI